MTEVQNERVIPDWSFGDRIRKARNLTGMTQAEFADAIGVGEPSLAQWETDRARPRDILDIAARVEQLTHIPQAWLLGVDATYPTKAALGSKRGSLPLPWAYSKRQPFGLHPSVLDPIPPGDSYDITRRQLPMLTAGLQRSTVPPVWGRSRSRRIVQNRKRHINR